MGTAPTPLRVSAAIAAVIALAVTIGMALAGANVARSASEGISSIEVLSNRADLISGGDALVAARLADGIDPGDGAGEPEWHRRDERVRLRARRRLEGLVTGSRSGRTP